MNVKIATLIAFVFVAEACYANASVADSEHAKRIASSWTSSDQPYINVINSIILEHKRGASTDEIVQEYLARANENPTDPLAQFGYVCSARWQNMEKFPGGQLPYSLVTRLKNVDPGNVHILAQYEFRMTNDAQYILPVKQAELEGDALLSYDPHDRITYRALIYELRDAPNGDEDGIRYAKKWLSWDSANPDPHLLLGNLYMNQWLMGKETNSYLRSEFHAEYKKVLELAPAGSSDVDIVRRFLKAADGSQSQ